MKRRNLTTPTPEQAKRQLVAMSDPAWAKHTIAAAGLAGDVVAPIFNSWSRKYGKGSNEQRSAANVWLRRFLSSKTVAGLPRRVRLDARADSVLLDEGTIDTTAKKLAALALHSGWPRSQCPELQALAGKLLVQLPQVKKDRSNLESCRLRAVDPDFWKRQIRSVHGRAFESVAIAAGLVNRRRALYVSDATQSRVNGRRRKNRDILSSLVATNEFGDSFTLQELADKGPSNPVIKRAELMVRTRGLEDYAKEQGDIGVFLTLTAPGRMHARQSKTGEENPNFCHASPRHVHQYLNTVWARTRAQWARDGIRCYGVRTVEPHHDGTPHWHLLLFVAPADRKAMLKTFRDYALQDSPSEKGAWLRRFTFKTIDPEKGSAVGYLAKYISKNIDGFKADGAPVEDYDFESSDAKLAKIHESAVRVGAWASSHGIRQFQFIGTTSVTVWRELRRLKADQVEEGLRAYVEAADASNWGDFVRLCGGPAAPRKDIPVCTHREARQNRYAEFVKVTKGVTFRPTGEIVETRIHVWTVASGASVDASSGARRATDGTPWTRVNNCTGIAPALAKTLSAEIILHQPPIPSLPPLTVPEGRHFPDWLGFLNNERPSHVVAS